MLTSSGEPEVNLLGLGISFEEMDAICMRESALRMNVSTALAIGAALAVVGAFVAGVNRRPKLGIGLAVGGMAGFAGAYKLAWGAEFQYMDCKKRVLATQAARSAKP